MCFIILKSLDKEKYSDKYDFSDPRKFFLNSDREIAYLTSVSHIRLARSKDGVNFKAEEKPFIKPETTTSLLEPEAEYERIGFFSNVVFSCDALIENDVLKVYYGGADRVMGLSELPLIELWQHL